MGKDFWSGSIESAYENKNESLSDPGYDGNKTYESGTYGQKDYTVRERSDGNYDVYIKSDSESGHSHDLIDSDGNIIENYHDYIFPKIQDELIKEKHLLTKKIY